MRVVICGAGVIGACAAYYLSRRGVDVVVVERREVACAASGKAGGFLAQDWSAGSLLDGLSRRSFALHARLAEELDGDWGYRRLTTYGGYAAAVDEGPRRGEINLGWLADRVVIAGRLDSPQTTALVRPAAFTEGMMGAAQARGVQLRHGRVTGIRHGDAGVEGVVVEGELLAADAVVIAMGPWSILAAAWLPLPGVFPDKGHSLIYDTGADIPGEALFVAYQEETGTVLTPKVFPRADGTTYVTVLSSQSPLPPDPADVAPDPGAIERLQAACARLSPALSEARIIARQACHRPTTQDNLPLIGRAPGVARAYIATGHGVWGILNAPATGEALSELIADGAARSTDLTPFDPGRLRPLDPAQLPLPAM
jgi:glycine/D-amino acid oxidase-like deaminating enzyme